MAKKRGRQLDRDRGLVCEAQKIFRFFQAIRLFDRAQRLQSARVERWTVLHEITHLSAQPVCSRGEAHPRIAANGGGHRAQSLSSGNRVQIPWLHGRWITSPQTTGRRWRAEIHSQIGVPPSCGIPTRRIHPLHSTAARPFSCSGERVQNSPFQQPSGCPALRTRLRSSNRTMPLEPGTAIRRVFRSRHGAHTTGTHHGIHRKTGALLPKSNPRARKFSSDFQEVLQDAACLRA